MEWQDKIKPQISGSYLVTILKWYQNDTYTLLKYVAWFDTEKQHWFKFDPFDETTGEQIKGIQAWVSESAIYPGTLDIPVNLD